MDEYISREAVFQVVHGIARRIATKDIESFIAKDMKTFYKIKGAKEILDSVDTDLCYIPAADVQPVKQWVKLHYKRPDTEGFYLVCDQYGECEVAEYIPDIKSWFTNKIKGEIRYWMPLPELPKEGETE